MCEQSYSAVTNGGEQQNLESITNYNRWHGWCITTIGVCPTQCLALICGVEVIHKFWGNL